MFTSVSVMSCRVAPRRQQTDQRVNVRNERIGAKYLRADVGMDTNNVDMVEAKGNRDRLFGKSQRNGEPELRVVVARSHVLVGVGVDAGCYAQPARHLLVALGSDRFDPVEFFQGIDHDSCDPRVDGEFDLGYRLIVAVENHMLHRDTGVLRGKEFPTGDDIDPESLFIGDLQDAGRAPCLGCVGDRRTLEGVAVGTTAPTKVVLVSDEQRRPVLCQQVLNPNPANGQLTVGVPGKAHRPRSGNHIRSGASIPRMSSRRPKASRV